MTASHTARPSKDAAGNVVTYLPSNVVDGDVQLLLRAPDEAGEPRWVRQQLSVADAEALAGALLEAAQAAQRREPPGR